MYGIPTFDSESFELELNGMPGGASGSSFVQYPFSVFGDHVSPHVHPTISGLPSTLTGQLRGEKIVFQSAIVHALLRGHNRGHVNRAGFSHFSATRSLHNAQASTFSAFVYYVCRFRIQPCAQLRFFTLSTSSRGLPCSRTSIGS